MTSYEISCYDYKSRIITLFFSDKEFLRHYAKTSIYLDSSNTESLHNFIENSDKNVNLYGTAYYGNGSRYLARIEITKKKIPGWKNVNI